MIVIWKLSGKLASRIAGIEKLDPESQIFLSKHKTGTNRAIAKSWPSTQAAYVELPLAIKG